MDSMDMASGDEYITFDSFLQGPFQDNTDGSYNAHMEFPDGSIPTISKASCGRMSPVRAKTVKEFYEQLSELKKENFSLKLRIFYMEERMNSNKEFTKDEYSTANINLKIEVESLKKELGDKAELLKKASNAMDNLAVQHQDELDEVEKSTEKEREKMVETVQKQLEVQNADILNEKNDMIEQLSRDVEMLTANVRMLEKEKQDTLNELNQRVAQLQTQLPDPKSSLEREKMDLLEIIEEQRQKSSELEVVLEQLSEELNQKEHAVETLQSEGAELKERYDRMKRKAKHADKSEVSITEKDTQINNLEQTISGLKQTLDQREKRCKQLENHITQMEGHLNKMKSEMTELKSTIAQNDKDLLIRAKAIQGLTQEAHTRGKENEKLCDRVEELEHQLVDATAELHTYKMSKYDRQSSTQKDLLEMENYVQKLQNQVKILQQDLRQAQSMLAEKDLKFDELQSNFELVKVHAEELENYSAEQKKSLTSRLSEQEEGLKHVAEKYENEKMAIRQQVRVLQADNQQKDQHLRLMYDLRNTADHLLQVTESKENNDSAVKNLRQEINWLRGRLPMPTSPSNDSPMAFTAQAPGSAAMENQRQFQDPHMSLAGPMISSTPVSPPRRDNSPPRRDHLAQTPPQHDSTNQTTPQLRPAPSLRPALIGSANPDLETDVTEYRDLAQSERATSHVGHASFTERLNRMNESELRQEVGQLSAQLRNAKELCSQLQQRVDILSQEHTLNSSTKRNSPNQATEIIKRLQFELENSKSRLKEVERLNGVMMQSGDYSLINLKSDVHTSMAELHDQSQVLSQRENRMTQVTWLVDRVRNDLRNLDSQMGDFFDQVSTAYLGEANESEISRLKSQMDELRICLREKCSELDKLQESMSRSPGKRSRSRSPGQDLVWDSRDLFHENRLLREKLGLTLDDDVDLAPSMSDVTKRLVQLTEELDRKQKMYEEADGKSGYESESKSLNTSRDNSSEVDRLCDEIIALRQENEKLATHTGERVPALELPEIRTPARVSDDNMLHARHQRQLETLRSELDNERQHNRSLMDVINSRTPNASFQGQGQGHSSLDSELRRAAITNNAKNDVTTRRDVTNVTTNDVTTDDGGGGGGNVVERLDEVCQMLNEILMKQDDLSDHVMMTPSSSRGDHVTVEYLAQLKKKLGTMVNMVQTVATTMDESLNSSVNSSMEKPLLDSSVLHKAREQCAHAQDKCALAESKCALLEHQCSELESKLSDAGRDCNESEERCSDLRQIHRLAEQKCLELERKCAELDGKFKEAMYTRQDEQQRLDELEANLNVMKSANEKLRADLADGKRAESELQHRVHELEEELGRSLGENQTLRHDVIMTQDLLEQTTHGLDRKSDDNAKLRAKLQKNADTIKQCDESLTSIKAMVKEKDEIIRLMKEKCKRLQRSKPRTHTGPSSTASEDDDVSKQRPPRRRKSRSKTSIAAKIDVTTDDVITTQNADRERLRHHTGSSASLVHEERLLSPGTGSDVIKSPSPLANIPMASDQSESVYESELNLDPSALSPDGEVERLQQRLRTTENMNETLRAELMLYQHLSQTLTSSAGSTPMHQQASRPENLGPRLENVSLHECSMGSWTNISTTKRPSSAPRLRLSEPTTSYVNVNDVTSERSSGATTFLASELAQHLLELRRLRERLEETIALNDDLTKQLNQQLRERETTADEESGLVRSLRHQVDVLRQDMDETQTQLHHVTTEAESYRSEAERAQLECQNLSTQQRRLAQDAELLREDNNRLTQDNNRMRADTGKTKEESLRLKENCNRLESERNRLKEQCSRYRGDCERLRNEAERKGTRLEEEFRDEVGKLKGKSGNLDLSQLVEEIARLRVQLERSISTNQALRQKLEEIIKKGGSDSLSASLKKLIRQSEEAGVEDDVMERADVGERRGSQSGRLREVVDQAYHYPPDSSDSGTCTGNRSLSNSHSSLPPMHRSRDDASHITRREEPLINREFPNLRRAVSALSLTESVASSRGTDVIQHCDVINDDDHILSVSMLEEEEQRRRAMPDFDLETRDDYLLLPPGGRSSLHAFQARPQRGMLGTRSVDDLRHIGGGHGHVTRPSQSYDRQHLSNVRINSDLRFLFAIGRLDDYEHAKKQLGECQIILRGVAARVQDRLQTYHGSSLIQSPEYTTFREVSTSVDNLLHCIHQASGLLYQFWTSQLPPRDHHGNYVDPEMQIENEELRGEIRRLKDKYSHVLQSLKSAQKRLHKSNKKKEDMEEAIYRQLSQTEKVVRQARINMEVKTGVTAADVLARRQTDS